MADIKKFTGYIAPDGSTHDTIKKATDYTRELKIKEALALFKGTLNEDSCWVGSDGQGPVVCADDLPAFLYANKDAIIAAFNPEVLLRAPRKKREAKSGSATMTAEPLTEA